MGQIFGTIDSMVSNPKTPYEFSKNDTSVNEGDLEKYKEYFQSQLEADARYVESLLTKEGSTGSVFFYERDILRISLDKSICSVPYGVLSPRLRVKCLLKNMKIPFTCCTRGEGQLIIISYVHNVLTSAHS